MGDTIEKYHSNRVFFRYFTISITNRLLEEENTITCACAVALVT